MRKEREKSLPEVLGEYARRNVARFHMPGHKGRGIPMYESLSGWDVTELPATDDLHAPTGPIRKTQSAYAKAYGARDCFLLVNGSTAGVQAMLLSQGQNKRVLMARDCHRSAVSGLALAGHAAEFIYPELDGMITPQAVEEALARRPADAVFITSPNYRGRCADVKGVAKAAHGHGALLLVDAAHGAHFPFANELPSLCPQDVDMFCVSAHKTLNAFTQTALLFTGRGCPIDAQRIQSVLSMLQSSSPSYPLMTSLDWALHTAKDWDTHVERMRVFQKRLSAANGVTVQTERADAARGVFAVDPTRLVIDVHMRGITGYAAYRDLYDKGVVAEAADMDHVIFITVPHDPQDWYDRLYEAVCTLPYGDRRAPSPPKRYARQPAVVSIRDAMLGDVDYVPLSQAAGRVAACAAGPYPPGVALFMPGERILQEYVDDLASCLQAGGAVFGLKQKENVCVLR
ncbi:MAG: aminotransferase class V-fold PLP-dependent enzyme [Eubacteriales bacterium]|nr:aminotransferase class V-fold PLP-dependent enzyme [Eubacteriales bacterium]